MLEDLVRFNFEEPSEELEFEQGFVELLEEVIESARFSMEIENDIYSLDEETKLKLFSHTNRLFLKTPTLINIALNYKICIEFGLPLHPTIYFNLWDAPKDSFKYNLEKREKAITLYLHAISTSQNIFRLDNRCIDELDAYQNYLPEFLQNFRYTNKRDRYTWRASDPIQVKSLASEIIAAGVKVDLVLGAAHGSICPAIQLSNMLNCDLYFLRHSRFKRKDPYPVISESDKDFMKKYQNKTVLFLDEDVAKGDTLRSFIVSLSGMFAKTYSAAVIRHYLSPLKPDFVGSVWYD
jgi:hypoxanthine phosphoribosyltransferase